MTETVYEKKASKEQANLVFRLPKNRKQIGQPGETEPEIFVEDYAWVFGKRLADRDYTGCVAGVLLGEVVHMESGKKILVRGIMEAAGAYCNDNVEFTEEVWASVYRDISTYFPEQEIVGWYLGGPGFLLEAEEKLKKIQIDFFGGTDKLLLKMDSIEREETFFTYRDGQLKPFSGYYIYYERNDEMQAYMLSHGMLPSLAEEEEIPQWAEKHKEQREMLEKGTTYNVRHSLYRLMYASGGMLACIAVLAIAGLVIQLKERNELRELLNRQSYEDAVQANADVGAGRNPTKKPEITTIPTEGEEGNQIEITSFPSVVPTQGEKPTPVSGKEPSLTPEATVTPVPTPTQAVQVSTLQREYVVKKGDTLASICMQFYGTVEILPEIMRINHLEDRDKIYAGQIILLP